MPFAGSSEHRCMRLLLVLLQLLVAGTESTGKGIADVPFLRESYFSIGAHMSGDALSKVLHKNVGRLLAVDEFQKAVDDHLGREHETMIVDESLADEVAQRVDQKLRGLAELLTTAYTTNISLLDFARTVPSCSVFHKVLATTSSQSCFVLHGPRQQLDSENTDIVLRKVANATAVQRQFMLVDEQQQLELPADFIDTNEFRHWRQFLAALAPTPRRIIVVLEMGMITSAALLKTAKETALHIVDLTTSEDHVHVIVAVGGDVVAECRSSEAGDHERARRAIFTLRLPTNNSEVSSHSAALNATFDLLLEEAALDKSVQRHNIVYYISRGMFGELLEAKEMLNSLAKRVVEMQRLRCPFKVNTILLAEPNRAPLSWSYEFLENIARQNFTIHRNSIEKNTLNELDLVGFRPSKGEMLVLNDIRKQLNLTMMLKMGTMSNGERHSGRGANARHVNRGRPDSDVRWTFDSEALTVTAFRHFRHETRSIVSGFDLSMDELFDDVFHAFAVKAAPPATRLAVTVVDLNGVVVATSSSTGGHQRHGRGGRRRRDHHHQHRRRGGEQRLNAVDGWPKSMGWLLAEFGNPHTQRGTFSVATTAHGVLAYTWRKLKEAPFVVVVSAASASLPVEVRRVAAAAKQTFAMENVLWHKNDDRQQRCLEHGYPVSQKFSSVYVPPSAYHPAARRLLSTDALKNNWVYLFDNVGFIRSNSLRMGVREHVGMLSNLTAFWQAFERLGKGDDPTIRRFAATVDGVLVVAPAQTIRDDFEPTEQKWFKEAMAQPGKVVLTGPAENSALGDVVTASIAVLANSKAAQKQVFAVLGMDLPSGVFNKWLREGIIACGQTRRCVLFAPDGNVLYSDASQEKPRSSTDAIERFHISHLEPILAARMSRMGEVVVKRQCIDANHELQRDSRWNTEFTRVFTIGCGESSTTAGSPLHSETLLVPETNVFLSMVNASCTKPVLGTFCPCSVSDRRCLFCGRFDANECECPCQCSYEETCNADDNLPACVEEPTNSEMTYEEIDAEYKNCPIQSCSTQLSALGCRASPGCEWCAFSAAGELVQSPVCAAIASCYQGVQGRSVSRDSDEQVDQIWPSKAPVGPLVACFLALSVLVVILAYCYRSQMSRLGERRVMFDGVPLFQRSGPLFEFDLDGSGFREMKQPMQLASFERAAPIVERDLPPTVSSDHGYSTMTDRNAAEDSECAESVLPSSEASVPPDPHPPKASSLSPLMIKSGTRITTSAIVHRIPDHVLKELSSPMIDTL